MLEIVNTGDAWLPHSVKHTTFILGIVSMSLGCRDYGTKEGREGGEGRGVCTAHESNSEINRILESVL